MAEVTVTLFLQKLYDLLEKKVHLLAGVRDDVCLLRDTLQWLHLSLREADETCNKDERIKLWFTQIRDVAFDAEDIIDAYLLEIERHHHHDMKARFRSCMGKPSVLHRIGKKIKTINARLDLTKENASAYGMKAGELGQGSSSSSREKRRRPIIEEFDGLVGIEKDAKKVSKLLVEGETRRRSVVSIYGMGGLGKTTLARYVYNCMEVQRHFECFAWISVSQEFRVHDLLCDAINCITGIEKETLRPKDEEDLGRQLLECLKGKVFLAVLDDMWNIDAWSGLATSFPNEANGSRILLTTRNKHLALRVDPLTELHEMRFLKEEECWELLCKKAFPRDHECPSNLKVVGKKMVKKCKGLPLAVVVLGGLLSRKKQTILEWTKVLDSISWQLSESEDEISSILALSYNDLPYHLKACFLHFASFPKDYLLRKYDLICMWVAEGFIKERGSERLEDIAEDYLMDLTDRSMIQLAEWEIYGWVAACNIHDLLRDVAIKKAKEEKFLDVYANADSVAPITTARRLAITFRDISECISFNHSYKYLRSLYCFSNDNFEKVEWKTIHGRFKFLRVMHITGLTVSTLPNEMGDLIHLRYILVRFEQLRSDPIRLPSTFSKLHNLQVLDLRAYGRTIYIHGDIWKMKELRHLFLSNSYFPEKAQHLQLYKLTNLQTLISVSAGDWIKDDLGKMTSLRRLGIHGDVTSYQDALFESIRRLENLRYILLEFQEGMIDVPIHLSHLVHLEKLDLQGHMGALPPFHDFPANLTMLCLTNNILRQDPMEILEKLPKLRTLKFFKNKCYVGKKLSCHAQGFPELKVLIIHDMKNLEEWIVEEGAMPKLRELHIIRCNSLKMIPEGFRHLISLQKLLLELYNDVYMRIKEDGEDWFKIKHIPLIERL